VTLEKIFLLNLPLTKERAGVFFWRTIKSRYRFRGETELTV
jgi:hypothetical protein